MRNELPPLITFDKLKEFIKEFNQKHSQKEEKAIEASRKLFGKAK